jgi:hypothetical protein
MEGLIVTVGAVLGALLVGCTIRLAQEMEHWSDKIRGDVEELRREVQELADGVKVIRVAMGISDKDFHAWLEEALSGVPDPGPAPDIEVPWS